MATSADHGQDSCLAENRENLTVNNPIYLSGNAQMHQGDIIHLSPKDAKQALREALHYESKFDKFDSLSDPDIPLRSFDWVWTTPFKTWLKGTSSASDTCFWISGKPGSGKSTLMHYLINDPETRRIVRKLSKSYVILNFFFDYRAGGKDANHETGLIKCFLSQLCEQAPEIEAQLVHRYSLTLSQGLEPQRCLQMLMDGLTNLGTAIYAFVDGLDEYEGNHAHLANTILRLQQQSGMNVCFASRPESLLVKKLGEFPTMYMHQHNGPSISGYVREAVRIAQHIAPNIESSIDGPMREAITTKADGVLIWARLVVDCLVEEAIRGTGRNDLAILLDTLPEDLQRMYDQTFLRIPAQERSDAALVLWLLNARGGSCLLEHLYGFWHFLHIEISGKLPSQSLHNVIHFATHIQRLCGSFIESHGVRKQRRWQFLLQRKTLSEPAPWTVGKPLRLLHKTLQPYVSSSEVISSILPMALERHFGRSLEIVCSAVVVKASEDSNLDLKRLNDDSEAGLLQRHDGDMNDVVNRLAPRAAEYYETRLRGYWSPTVPHWQRSLLALSLSVVNDYHLSKREFYRLTPTPYRTAKAALCSPISLALIFMPPKPTKPLAARFLGETSFELHRLSLSDPLNEHAKWSKARQHHCLDLILAMDFGLDAYIDLTRSKGAVPDSDACTWLWHHIMEMVAEMQPYTAGRWHTVEKVIDLLRPHISHVDLGMLFHLSEVVVKKAQLPHRTSRLAEPRLKVFSGMISSLHPSSAQLQLSWKWTHQKEPSSYVGECMREPSHALHRWVSLAIEVWREPSRASASRASGKTMLYDILVTLSGLSLWCTTIDTVCDFHHGVLQYFITELDGMWGLDYSWLEILISLAKLGATPPTEASLEQILVRFHLMAQYRSLRNIPLSAETADINQPLREILEFYRMCKQWPDFGPYIDNYKLSRDFLCRIPMSYANRQLSKIVRTTSQGESETEEGTVGIVRPS